jgi:ribokinase
MTGRVIVVGSINVDLVIRGERLPAPGETVTGGTFERHQGGKGGNQAVAAARLGRPTAFIGAVGDDPFGEEAKAALAAEGVDVSGLQSVRGAATGVALILVDASGENLITVASGANALLTPNAVREALGGLGSLDGDVILVSREVPSVTVLEALRVGRVAGARTVLNPAPAVALDPGELALTDVLTPNHGELVTCVAALDAGDGRDSEAGLSRLLLAAGVVEAVVVTRGAGGALLVRATGTATAFSALPVSVVDTTGAGDAFAGALAAGLAAALSIEEAVRRAVVAAGLSTRFPGAREGMPRSMDLEAAVTPDR